MNQGLQSEQSSTHLGVGSEEIDVQEAPTAGARLDAARAADRKWRARLALRVDRRLEGLRQSDKVIQRVGNGINGALALAAMVMAWRDASMVWPMSLMAGTFAVSFAAALLIAFIAWFQDRTRSRIIEMRLPDELLPGVEEAHRKANLEPSGDDRGASSWGRSSCSCWGRCC